MEFKNLVKLEAFGVIGTWAQSIKRESHGICQQIAHEVDNKDKVDRVLQLLGFEHIPKPYDAAFLYCRVEPIRDFRVYLIFTDRFKPTMYFYFNPQSVGLIHGEDVIVWVEAYIRLLGRAFSNIDSVGVKLEDRFHYSTRIPKTKQKQLYALAHHSLETICIKYNYFLDFETTNQWQITINQCPGLILQIRRFENNILYGYRAARALTYKPPSYGAGPTTIAFLHLNHILREKKLLGLSKPTVIIIKKKIELSRVK